MSINSAMLAGVSGLVANSSALAAISDNIANVNTTAYKRNQVNFANMVTSQSVAGRYSAGGVQGITRQFVSQQGLIQSSASSTDLAIAGDGFFIGTEKGSGLTAADSRLFTRSGSFHVDSDGFLINDAGLYLQGWPAQANGTFNVSPSDLNAMASINVKNLGAAVQQTTEVALSANLDKTQALSAAAGTPRWSTAQGIAANSVDFDLTKLTQYADASTVNSVNSNGASVGAVVGVEVSDDGIVSAIFDNSQVRQIAKIGIATFPNSDGLKAVSGNAYMSSLQAGQMVIKEAGLGGAGKVSPSSLESSTVDLSSEFTGLISTQKAYSASSKIITTADQMLDELINIIR